MTIYYTYFPSPIGTIYMAFSPKGICQISFHKQREEGFCQKLRNRFNASITHDPGLGKEVKNDILSYLAGEKKTFAEYELDTSQGTSFQRQVWAEVKKITYGQTRPYQWIARQIGSPNSQRAVGQANGNNPIPLIIPCHRVVCSNGKLGGYSEGVHIKKQLLELERLNTETKEEKWL